MWTNAAGSHSKSVAQCAVTFRRPIPYSWQAKWSLRINKPEGVGAHMKTITRTTIGLPAAEMILITVLALPVAAQTAVPFKGTFQGSDTVVQPELTQNIA